MGKADAADVLGEAADDDDADDDFGSVSELAQEVHRGVVGGPWSVLVIADARLGMHSGENAVRAACAQFSEVEERCNLHVSERTFQKPHSACDGSCSGSSKRKLGPSLLGKVPTLNALCRSRVRNLEASS